MLYFLIQWLEGLFHPPGFQIVEFITVRATLAAITAFVIVMVIGPRVIRWLERKQLGEEVRTELAANGVDHSHKRGTPTMGGLIIVSAIVIATLLWGDLREVYIWLILIATLWMAAFGFSDDYIKTILKDKAGLAARMKLTGQIGLGLLVGLVMYFHPQFQETRSLTELPIFQNWHLDYNVLGNTFFGGLELGWILFIPMTILVVTGTSNAVNLTDGLDGLAAGITSIVTLGLIVFVYISGHQVFSSYLGVMHLPGSGELTIFMSAMAVACLGFLWFNSYPASVFMGDTGSLALGAAIAVAALMIKKELLLPLLCAVFFVETLSVIIQTSYFRYTRRKEGAGKRIFRMAPLHHHYEVNGMHEVKIVTRFYLVTIVTVLATLLTLRIR
ncbi:MAG: phospho-N-acetylmuramoyl-pentapeptide-transferase [Bacteroidetes bacterium]|nr:phospho-N-acetylmuramoyl-pentapeptide-transferase [Bacteroidota bacterium]MCY4205087.1 phospho-N-acetylmuramoyl-pentapeptide-transferase [Bacteroidota bacterium]MCY4279247.1 phospho-N-acetylmuramoyl-pentapeptide-transferase [Acidimicrobiaceae bacterium]